MKVAISILMVLISLSLTGQINECAITFTLGQGIPLNKPVQEEGYFKFPMLYPNMIANSVESMFSINLNSKFSTGFIIRDEYYHTWNSSDFSIYSGTKVNIFSLSPIIEYSLIKKEKLSISPILGISYNRINISFDDNNTFFASTNPFIIGYYKDNTLYRFNPLIKVALDYSFELFNLYSTITYQNLKLESPLYLDKGINSLYISIGIIHTFPLRKLYIKKRYYLGE